tara:strand:+ start:189 stop:467 length:279 start_codon:yes stop_codon:yes gene_type:complete
VLLPLFLNKELQMRCKYHPNTELLLAEVVTTKSVPWSDEKTRLYHDVEYCPECFIEHEDGKIWRNDLVDEPLFTNITKKIDETIDIQIDQRK